MRIRQRMRILSDHRESKDSSPATLLIAFFTLCRGFAANFVLCFQKLPHSFIFRSP